jgi:hypothetical protein
MRLKYVVYRQGSDEGAVVFNEHLVHSCVAEGLNAHNFSDMSNYGNIKVVSAGFCGRDEKEGWKVWGNSESLGLESRPIDARIIRRVYG